MAVIITDKTPDVYLTKAEEAQYRADFQRDYMFYAGPVPSFEEYVLSKQRGLGRSTVKINNG